MKEIKRQKNTSFIYLQTGKTSNLGIGGDSVVARGASRELIMFYFFTWVVISVFTVW